MASISETAVKNIGKVLNDPTRPMKERFRALFTLRNLGGEVAIKEISECFIDESVLLKHELAYCLGQMQDKRAIPVLRRVLEDKNHDPIVRHEAAYTTTDFLDSERSSFFGYTQEIMISTSTLELVEQLGTAVMEHSDGERRIRRYFDNYDTPFIGDGRRKS